MVFLSASRGFLMQSMITFSTWFLSNLPAFFMSEPVCYIWGLALTFYIFHQMLLLKHY